MAELTAPARRAAGAPVATPLPAAPPTLAPVSGSPATGSRGALAAFSAALVSGTSRIFGQVQRRGGTALAGFRARPEHSRWRIYALGLWSLIVAATLAFQFWTDNPLGVYVKIQQVDIPRSTFIFVRNDSSKPWRHARLKLNGIYAYEREDVSPGDNLRLEPGQFAVLDAVSGRRNRFPRNAPLETLSLDCEQGHYETMLKP